MSEDLMLSHVAKLNLLGRQSREALMQVLVSRDILDEAELADHPPFFFRAEISSNLLDSHFTHMNEKTLNNYAEDALRGVAFLRGHNHHELPLGYSIASDYESGEKKRVLADFYTVPGLPETNDLIVRIKTGLVRDVSVGFHGGRALCDLCGSDFWDCRHFPGLKYEEKEGDTVKTQLATYTIDDARLSEVSGVFDGSTPDAMILKAQRAAKAGQLTEKQVEVLQNRYRTSLPVTKFFVVPEIPKEENKTMDEKDLQRVRSVFVRIGTMTEEEARAIDETSIIGSIEVLGTVITNLQPQAAEGRQYRADLVQDALAQGVRAQGADFEKTLYQNMLETAPLALVKRMRDDWKKVADTILPAGRSSTESGDPDPKNKDKKEKRNADVPEAAYNT